MNERPSNNHAMVFNASFPGEQGRRAFERFTAHGPLAVLPLPSGNRSEQRYNVVWSMSDAQLSVISQLDDAAFINEFQRAFGWRLVVSGRWVSVANGPWVASPPRSSFARGICW